MFNAEISWPMAAEKSDICMVPVPIASAEGAKLMLLS